NADELLGLDLTEIDAVDDREAAFLDEEAERTTQRADTDATRGTVAPVRGLRGMSPTATHEDGRADRTVTSVTGALLLVDLLARSLDSGALFTCAGSRTT